MLKSRAEMSRTTYGRAMVTCPMICASRPKAMILSGCKKAKKNPAASTIGGTASGANARDRSMVARRDAQEPSPTARLTPSGVAMSAVEPANRRLWKSAPRRSGS